MINSGAAIPAQLRHRGERCSANLQDTGTAIIVGKKGQRVWTGGVMKRRWRAVSITLISKIICVLAKRAAGYV